MKKKISNILVALIVVGIGVLLILKAVGVLDNLFFPGWWTLFLIIPPIISMIRSKPEGWHFFLIGLGVVLLLNANNILADFNIWLLIVGVLVVSIGLGILFSGVQANKRREAPKINNKDANSYSAVFGGQSAKNTSTDYKGSYVTAVFGGVDLDLRETVLNEDAQISCTAVCGGIEIYVPQNVNIQLSGVPILGGCTDKVKRTMDPAFPTLYINYVCVMGGLEILP